MSMISGNEGPRGERDRRESTRLRGARSASRRKDRSSEDIADLGLRDRDRSNEDMPDLGLRNKQRLQKLNEALSKSGLYRNETPPRFGGTIPSPQQRGSMPSRRPAMEGGDRMERERVATLRSLLGQLEMPSPPMPTVRDMPGMTTEEMEPYNRPAGDINDAFFGPDRERFDIIEFLMNLTNRGR